MRHLVFVMLLCINSGLFGQNMNADRIEHFNHENKLAIQGYDPVSYFNQGNAVKGSFKNKSIYMGIVYYFSSEANKNIFDSNPSKFEPQYGGWCAYAMGDYGKKVEIDPHTFKIIDGNLYLFYNAYFNNTLKGWNKDEINLKAKADENWSKFLKN